VHAEIVQENGAFYISDCNSKNGTFVNDARILQNSRTQLKSGDIVRFANAEYVFML
jgi:pSer/pThr/pTyr-binding forkhead associated (FHA) protein